VVVHSSRNVTAALREVLYRPGCGLHLGLGRLTLGVLETRGRRYVHQPLRHRFRSLGATQHRQRPSTISASCLGAPTGRNALVDWPHSHVLKVFSRQVLNNLSEPTLRFRIRHVGQDVSGGRRREPRDMTGANSYAKQFAFLLLVNRS
jgi:hypothetical protein